MRLSLKARFRLIIVLTLCLAAPLSALADFSFGPPCPMMTDGSMPTGPGAAHPCKTPCLKGSMADDACGSCQSCNIGSVFTHPSSLNARGIPPAHSQPISAVASLIDHAPAPLWRPPRTV